MHDPDSVTDSGGDAAVSFPTPVDPVGVASSEKTFSRTASARSTRGTDFSAAQWVIARAAGSRPACTDRYCSLRCTDGRVPMTGRSGRMYASASLIVSRYSTLTRGGSATGDRAATVAAATTRRRY
ncbi:hypothetical protein NJ76_20045, partial [Rhodococcus sp. IITR03]